MEEVNQTSKNEFGEMLSSFNAVFEMIAARRIKRDELFKRKTKENLMSPTVSSDTSRLLLHLRRPAGTSQAHPQVSAISRRRLVVFVSRGTEGKRYKALCPTWTCVFRRGAKPNSAPHVAGGPIPTWTCVFRRSVKPSPAPHPFDGKLRVGSGKRRPTLLEKWTPEVILGQLAMTFSMRGGCKRFMAIESKSLDFTIVGTAEDVLKISENGRGRRTSVFLPEHVALWLLRAWADFISPNPPIGVIKCAKALVFFF
ncbi:hypothetical protein Cgig2_027306 [Carnegiea gigantea]|uniref:Uncharacterized protein n=1 Tax=Carnegiea gigantea TaxID=171969 RepID=A0A9Q1Q7U3_9CARY|nr:hypothetical protein Cgig2_027306 [Carnegiea gigantea]